MQEIIIVRINLSIGLKAMPWLGILAETIPRERFQALMYMHRKQSERYLLIISVQTGTIYDLSSINLQDTCTYKVPSENYYAGLWSYTSIYQFGRSYLSIVPRQVGDNERDQT